MTRQVTIRFSTPLIRAYVACDECNDRLQLGFIQHTTETRVLDERIQRMQDEFADGAKAAGWTATEGGTTVCPKHGGTKQ